MSETPGPRAMSPRSRTDALGHGPVVEDRVHVTHEQHVRSPAPRRVPSREAERRPPACGRHRPPTRDRGTAPTWSAIRLTPSGEYEPQSTLTIVSSTSRNSGYLAWTRSRSVWTSMGDADASMSRSQREGEGGARGDRRGGGCDRRRGPCRRPRDRRAGRRGPRAPRGERRVSLGPVGDRARELGRPSRCSSATREPASSRRWATAWTRLTGDPVVLAWAVPCGTCGPCRRGVPRRCSHAWQQPPVSAGRETARRSRHRRHARLAHRVHAARASPDAARAPAASAPSAAASPRGSVRRSRRRRYGPAPAAAIGLGGSARRLQGASDRGAERLIA